MLQFHMSSKKSSATVSPAEFDAFTADYDAALDRGLALTGESKTYFAEGRLKWLAACLRTLGYRAENCLDFGCGIGTATPLIASQLGVGNITGIDPSAESLEVARSNHAGSSVRFENSSTFGVEGEFDLAYCNGVFHHIPSPERADAAAQVFRALKPGGYFSLWENNAWNPFTRFLMSRVPFDKDAVLLWPRGARRMLREAGFEIVRTDFAFIFPGALKLLRGLERPLHKVPFGGQYQVLARKPSAAGG
jgi:SAM-dependent methyltransferase